MRRAGVGVHHRLPLGLGDLRHGHVEGLADPDPVRRPLAVAVTVRAHRELPRNNQDHGHDDAGSHDSFRGSTLREYDGDDEG